MASLQQDMVTWNPTNARTKSKQTEGMKRKRKKIFFKTSRHPMLCFVPHLALHLCKGKSVLRKKKTSICDKTGLITKLLFVVPCASECPNYFSSKLCIPPRTPSHGQNGQGKVLHVGEWVSEHTQILMTTQAMCSM